MANQSEIDKACMNTALEWAKLSKAVRKKVGAVIYKDDTIISIGFNGTPNGFDNCCEVNLNVGLITKSEVIHAEFNAIVKMAKSTLSCNGATLYITCAPCIECSKLILQSGISRVVYLDDYRQENGVKLLEKGNIIVERFK